MRRIIGYTAGVFDLFHIGHLKLIINSKKACDFLIVGVTTDELTFSLKGRKPVIPFEERLEIVKSIRYVDQAVPEDNIDKFEAFKRFNFNKTFKGDDWKGTNKWKNLEKEFQKIGVEVVYFPYTQHTSSTKLREVLDKID